MIDDSAIIPPRSSRPGRGQGRLGDDIVVFQPHRYRPRISLGKDFHEGFGRRITPVVTEIYPPESQPLPG